MKAVMVRFWLPASLLAVMVSGLVVITAGSVAGLHLENQFGKARPGRVANSAFTPAGRLAVVEVRAEGPDWVLPEVEVRADGPEHRLDTVEVVASASGPARGLLSVVEVQARRPGIGLGEIAGIDTLKLKVN